MTIRCRAFFKPENLDAVEVQVFATMSRSPGVVPDVGQLVFRANGEQPPALKGDLIFYNSDFPQFDTQFTTLLPIDGTSRELYHPQPVWQAPVDTEIIKFHDCILDDPQERRSGLIDYAYNIKDRRWKWEFPVLFGEWNIRDEKNKLIVKYQKGPKALASLCLDALGEPQAGPMAYDVSVLPTDPELAPHVVWHYTSAAESLQSLCDFLGCEVHLLNNNSVKIVQKGIGTIPNNDNLEVPAEIGLIINPAPDYITAYSGDTLFDDWLALDPCGKELDGRVRHIERLSYRPTGGWKGVDPDSFAEDLYESLGGMPEKTKRATVEIAMQTVFRMFRISGFSRGVSRPPGFDDDMPMSQTNSGSSYALFDPESVSIVGTYAREIEAFEAAGTFTRDTVMIRPGFTGFDTRVVIPLESARLLAGNADTKDENERRPAELHGSFVYDFSDAQYVKFSGTEAELPWLYGFQMDAEKGYVYTNRAAWKYTTDSAGKEIVVPAALFLRTGFRLRQQPYGNRYHQQWTIPTGSGLGTANGVVPRIDVYEENIRVYSTEYAPLTGSGAASNLETNLTTVQRILQAAAQDNFKQYQNTTAPQRKQYTPFRAINTDGKVQQVTYSCGVGQFGRTVASIGAQYDYGQPTSVQKRRMFLEKKASDQQAKNFTKEFDKIPSVKAAVEMKTVPLFGG